jgi:hypothetical protein
MNIKDIVRIINAWGQSRILFDDWSYGLRPIAPFTRFYFFLLAYDELKKIDSNKMSM